jgi:RNA polymerase sigma-70 factor (ECF subfamily)
MIDRQVEFEQHRSQLFALAYRMLGTRADAEDVVQEAWLRWESARDADVRAPRSYLTTIVARLALDALKSARRKRETYIGPWLPEPLVEAPGTRHVEMAESLSVAFLHVLESLSPSERVAFLLREVFDAGYDEIASALDTSEANTRQLVTRARKHLHDERPRFSVDRDQQRRVLESFLQACSTGNPSALTAILSEDAVLYGDGGGKVPSALNPIYGPDRISRFLVGVTPKIPPGTQIEFTEVNGEPGLLLVADGRPHTVITIALDGEGRIRRIFSIANPEKLGSILM